ncbi:hypothetical protein Ddc_15826 [Ditylenchus destructor]|nr:hypothetical protein Ddc_15826 [Ditylenchus destructor]
MDNAEVSPLVLRNDVWSPLGYDTKIDVFKFLRPYDIRKFCVYVNKSWASFCIENQNYIPHPRFVPRRTVEQRYCLDENQAYEQRIDDEYKKRMKAERQKRCRDFRQPAQTNATLLAHLAVSPAHFMPCGSERFLYNATPDAVNMGALDYLDSRLHS